MKFARVCSQCSVERAVKAYIFSFHGARKQVTTRLSLSLSLPPPLLILSRAHAHNETNSSANSKNYVHLHSTKSLGADRHQCAHTAHIHTHSKQPIEKFFADSTVLVHFHSFAMPTILMHC